MLKVLKVMKEVTMHTSWRAPVVVGVDLSADNEAVVSHAA
jgi:hypothetical protein